MPFSSRIGQVLSRVVVVAPLVIASGLAAQEAPLPEGSDTLRVVELDPVVVTVSHLETLRSRVPNSVAVVTRDRIRESGAASVLRTVSEQVPGVFVTQRGVLGYGVAQGAAGNISIRGVGATPNTQVLVMTDGRPQTMGLFGHPLPDTHVASGVERVEVIRGPASVLYGTNAMGGVVNIITRRDWAPGLQLGGDASYGSYATQRQELSLAYGAGARSGVTLAGNRYRTDGHRPNSSFAIDNVTARGRYELRPGLGIAADAAVSDILTLDPGPISAPRIDNWVDVRRGSGGIALENHAGRISGATRLFYNFGRHDIHDGFFSRDHTLGLQLHQGMALGARGTLTVGADAKRMGGEAENRTAGMSWGSHEVDEFGVFALAHQPVVREVVATGGVRVNHHSEYGTELAPQVGVAVPVAAATTLKASTARGFRSPTIRELYLFPAPNPELEPERAWSHEVSLLHSLGAFTSLELVAFRMDGSNLIRTSGSFPNLVLSNSGSFSHSGGEVVVTTAPLPRLRLDASYGYLDAGETTQGHPRHQAHGGVRYQFPRVLTNLAVQHVAGLYASDGARDRLPDYTVLNARIGVNLPAGLVAHLSAENLLNTEYQVVRGYPMPGRTFEVGLQVRGH